MSQTHELRVRLLGSAAAAAKTKAEVCRWLEERGRSDYVESVMDGVEDPLLDAEMDRALPDSERIDSAPLALFDQSLSALQLLAEDLTVVFRGRVSVHFDVLDDDSWSQCWDETFATWTSEQFCVYPVGSVPKASQIIGRTALVIDGSGGAFGTGQHATTRCLIGVIEKNWMLWGKPESVLDVGCGTGILTIIAGKLGANVLAATEIAGDLVVLAKENCAHNGISCDVRLSAEPDFKMQFDLVIANILSPVLHELLARLTTLTKIGGRVLLAGFVAKEAGPLLERAGKLGLTLETQHADTGWLGLVLVRR